MRSTTTSAVLPGINSGVHGQPVELVAGAGGNVFVSGNTLGSGSSAILGAVTISSRGLSGSTGTFSLTATGSLIAGGIAANAPSSNAYGNISLVELGINGGALTINGSLSAQGSLVIQNQNPNGSIIIGNGTTCVTIATNATGTSKGTNGQIQIYLGTTAPAVTNGHTSGTLNNINVSQTTSGTAYFGSNPNQIQGGTGGGTPAQINLIRQNVYLNVPNTTGTITINQNATVTADPQPGMILLPRRAICRWNLKIRRFL